MFQIESKMFWVLEKMKKKTETKSNENTIATKNRNIFFSNFTVFWYLHFYFMKR